MFRHVRTHIGKENSKHGKSRSDRNKHKNQLNPRKTSLIFTSKTTLEIQNLDLQVQERPEKYDLKGGLKKSRGTWDCPPEYLGSISTSFCIVLYQTYTQRPNLHHRTKRFFCSSTDPGRLFHHEMKITHGKLWKKKMKKIKKGKKSNP